MHFEKDGNEPNRMGVELPNFTLVEDSWGKLRRAESRIYASNCASDMFRAEFHSTRICWTGIVKMLRLARLRCYGSNKMNN